MVKILIPGRNLIFSELVPHWQLRKNLIQTFEEVGANFVPHALSPVIVALVGLLLSVFIVYPRDHQKDHVFLNFISIVLSFYLSIWIIIPADPSNISGFIAIILPLFYLLLMTKVQFSFRKNQLLFSIKNVFLILILFYNLIRLLNNIMLWSRLFT